MTVNPVNKAVTLFTLIAGSAFTVVANSETLPNVNGPVQWSGGVNIATTQSCGEVSVTVPLTKRLIIQYLSGGVAIDQGDAVSFDVETTVGGITTRHSAKPEFVGPAWGYAKSYIVHQPITLYADPGTLVRFFACDTLTGRATMSAIISGRLYPPTNDRNG